MTRLLPLATALILFAGPVLADGSQATVDAGKPDECPDYGSYAVVDGVPRQKGPIRAEPYNGCADLPMPRGRVQPQLFIGAEVQIGGQNGSQGPGSGTGTDTPGRPGMPSGWPGPGGRPGAGASPSSPRPAPVLAPLPGWSRPAH